MWKRVVPPILIVVVASIVLRTFVNISYFPTHDGIFHLARIKVFHDLLQGGYFPVRWAGMLDQGRGIPLFSFIYPLPYYLSAIPMFLGASSVTAIKLVTLFSLGSGAIGFYALYAAKNRLVALALALVYLTLPYQLLNIFVRGALGEIVALGIIPWVIYSYTSLRTINKLKWYHPIPLFLLLLSHNFLGLIFLFYLTIDILFNNKRKLSLVSLCLSLGMSAFFVLPMIFERRLLASTTNGFSFEYGEHFLYLRQLITGNWDFGYSVIGIGDGISFELGVVQLLLTLGGTIAIGLAKKKKIQDLFLVITFFTSIFMMTGRSQFVWQLIPLLASIQFPWRLLFIPAFLTPVLGSHFFVLIKPHYIKNLLALVLIFASVYTALPISRSNGVISLDKTDELVEEELESGTTTTFRQEILPLWATLEGSPTSDQIYSQTKNIDVYNIDSRSNSLIFTVNNRTRGTALMTIARNYFPSWRLINQDTGVAYYLKPGEGGEINFDVNPGVHQLKLIVMSTEVERLSNLISVFTLVTLIISLNADYLSRKTQRFLK